MEFFMRILKIIIFINLLPFLSGCFAEKVDIYNSKMQEDFAFESALLNIDTLSKKLISYHVKIIKENDSILLLLPNKKIFNSDSANFNKKMYEILNLILELTNYYEKSVISVIGFTRPGATDIYSKALAAERAHRVVNYLWGHGIDANFMYSDAIGIPITTFTTSKEFILTDCVGINFSKPR
jgi:outer membrane protein OmpA-like peptidoglycan-associated protein